MDFATAVRHCLQNYATFSGRARRSEFWWFVLFNLIVTTVTTLVDGTLSGAGPGTPGVTNAISGLLLFLPSLSVAVRRLHDIGRSGWWWWLFAIPFIGWIILIIWYCQQSQPGINRFGPDPLGREVIRPMAPTADLSAMTSPLPEVHRSAPPDVAAPPAPPAGPPPVPRDDSPR